MEEKAEAEDERNAVERPHDRGLRAAVAPRAPGSC